METFWVDYALPFSGIMLIGATLIALGFGLIQMVQNFKSAIVGISGVAGLLLIYLAGYLLSGTPDAEYLKSL